MAFERRVDFGFCVAPFGDNVFAELKDLGDSSGAVTQFKGPAKKEAYTEIYGTKIVNSSARGSVHGINLIYESDEVCDAATNTNYMLTLAVECSNEYTGTKDAYVLKIIGEEDCNPTVVVLHEAGCSDYFISNFAWWLYWKPMMYAIVLMLLGCLIGVCGKKSFSIVVPVTDVTYFGILALWPATLIGAGESVLFFLLGLAVLAAAALFLAWCLHKEEHLGVSLVILALILGINLGSIVIALVWTNTGYCSVWLLYTCMFSFIIATGLFAKIYQKSLRNMTKILAGTGAFLFVRGLSLAIGGWPADAAVGNLIANDQDLEIGKVAIWAYFLGSLTLSWIFYIWLKLYQIRYCDTKVQSYY